MSLSDAFRLALNNRLGGKSIEPAPSGHFRLAGENLRKRLEEQAEANEPMNSPQHDKPSDRDSHTAQRIGAASSGLRPWGIFKTNFSEITNVDE